MKMCVLDTLLMWFMVSAVYNISQVILTCCKILTGHKYNVVFLLVTQGHQFCEIAQNLGVISCQNSF